MAVVIRFPTPGRFEDMDSLMSTLYDHEYAPSTLLREYYNAWTVNPSTRPWPKYDLRWVCILRSKHVYLPSRDMVDLTSPQHELSSFEEFIEHVLLWNFCFR
jgi:hypothetical protein